MLGNDSKSSDIVRLNNAGIYGQSNLLTSNTFDHIVLFKDSSCLHPNRGQVQPPEILIVLDGKEGVTFNTYGAIITCPESAGLSVACPQTCMHDAVCGFLKCHSLHFGFTCDKTSLKESMIFNWNFLRC